MNTTSELKGQSRANWEERINRENERSRNTWEEAESLAGSVRIEGEEKRIIYQSPEMLLKQQESIEAQVHVYTTVHGHVAV